MEAPHATHNDKDMTKKKVIMKQKTKTVQNY